MKRLYVITLIGLISLWPVMADEPSPYLYSTNDVHMALTQIDLRITLKLYEKLRTELMEVITEQAMELDQLPNESRTDPAMQDRVVRQRLELLSKRQNSLDNETRRLRDNALELGQRIETLGSNSPTRTATR
jgi:hypothetical protein